MRRITRCITQRITPNEGEIRVLFVVDKERNLQLMPHAADTFSEASPKASYYRIHLRAKESAQIQKTIPALSSFRFTSDLCPHSTERTGITF